MLSCNRILGVDKENAHASWTVLKEEFSGTRVIGKDGERGVWRAGNGLDCDAGCDGHPAECIMSFGGRRSEGPARREGSAPVLDPAGLAGFLVSLIPLPPFHIWKILSSAYLEESGSQLPWALTSSLENMGGKLVNYCFRIDVLVRILIYNLIVLL